MAHSPTSMKNSYKSIRQTCNPIEKMRKRLEQAFTKADTQMANKHMIWSSKTIEMQLQAHKNNWN